LVKQSWWIGRLIEKTTMDKKIVIWTMSLEEPKEEVATWPSEPYTLDWDAINWN